MALRTGVVTRTGEAQHAFVLDVAIRAGGCKSLLRMMQRTVVASQACFIVHGLLKTGGGNVAGRTFVPDQVMRVCDRPGIIRRGASTHCMPAQPSDAEHNKHGG